MKGQPFFDWLDEQPQDGSLDARTLLAELESTYAMAEERTLHKRSAAPAPQQAEEITFF